MNDGVAKNTDRELYREPDLTGNGSYYSDSIFITDSGAIGINVGGFVIVKTLSGWHKLGITSERLHTKTKEPE